MKTYIKKYAIAVLAVLSLVCFAGCEKDSHQEIESLEQTAPTIVTKERTVTSVSFEELEQVLGTNKEYLRISKRFELRKLAAKSKKDAHGTQTSTIKKTTLGDRTKYTLALEEEKEGEVQNLSLEIDGALQGELLTYDLSSGVSYNQEEGTFQVGTLEREVLTTSETAEILAKGTDCSVVRIGFPVPCNGFYQGVPAGHVIGDTNCIATLGPRYVWIHVLICDSVGGGTGPQSLIIPNCYAAGSCEEGAGSGGAAGQGGGGFGDPGDPFINTDGGETDFVIYYDSLLKYLWQNLTVSSHANGYLERKLTSVGPIFANLVKSNGETADAKVLASSMAEYLSKNDNNRNRSTSEELVNKFLTALEVNKISVTLGKELFNYIKQNNYTNTAAIQAEKVRKVVAGEASVSTLNTVSLNKLLVKAVAADLKTKGADFSQFPSFIDGIDPDNILGLRDWLTISSELRSILLLSINPDGNRKAINKKTTNIALIPRMKEMAVSVGLPKTAAEWSALLDVMKPLLVDIGIEMLPLGGAVNSIRDFSEGLKTGDYIAASLGIAGIIAEFIPATKLFKIAKKLFTTVKKAFGIVKSVGRHLTSLSKAIQKGFRAVFENSQTLLKKNGNIVARGDDVGKFVDNLERGILGILNKVGNKVDYKNPAGHILKWTEQHPNSIKQSITSALTSTNAGKTVEGKVGDFIQKAGKKIEAFGLKVNNSTTSKVAGDIDVMTKSHIIEVKKSAASFKKGQVDKFTDSTLDNYLNPLQKKAVLYIDKPLSALDRSKILSEIPEEVTLVNSLNELLNILN